MKKALLNEVEIPFIDAGIPKVRYENELYEVVQDQSGEPYFMLQGKALYIEIVSDTCPQDDSVLNAFKEAVAWISLLNDAVKWPEAGEAIKGFMQHIAELEKEKATYIVASSHGPTLDDSVDNFTAFRGGDGYAYSEAHKEYKKLLDVDTCTLAVLAKVIESTDY